MSQCEECGGEQSVITTWHTAEGTKRLKKCAAGHEVRTLEKEVGAPTLADAFAERRRALDAGMLRRQTRIDMGPSDDVHGRREG
jgi:hypothetical protein